MEHTLNLTLPYILPSQAQKHVTHNEALRLLDGMVQLSAIDRDLSTPPATPGEGDRYLVAAGATGAWEGWERSIAYFVDGSWWRLTARHGWLCWVEDEARLYVFDGADWQAVDGVPASDAEIQNARRLGVGTEADAENPFAAKLNRALWTALSDAESGTGDLRIALNKEAAADVAGLLFQSDFSTRARMGLLGSDDWQLDVSQDGSAFNPALSIDRSTAAVSHPGNAKFLAHINYDQYIPADSWTKVAINAADANEQGSFDAAANDFTAVGAGLYAFGAAVGWKQNGANVPSVTKAKFVLNGISDVTAPLVSGPISALATGGTETALHLHALAELGDGDTVELHQLFAGTDGYAPQTVTRFWSWRVA